LKRERDGVRKETVMAKNNGKVEGAGAGTRDGVKNRKTES
jgi:hypothetical protein